MLMLMVMVILYSLYRGNQEGGFDFDAHVARLMEASERETGLLRQRTADDDLKKQGLSRLRRAGDDGGDSDSDADSDDSGEFDEALLEGLDVGGGEGGVGGEGTEERSALDAQFEAVSLIVSVLYRVCLCQGVAGEKEGVGGEEVGERVVLESRFEAVSLTASIRVCRVCVCESVCVAGEEKGVGGEGAGRGAGGARISVRNVVFDFVGVCAEFVCVKRVCV